MKKIITLTLFILIAISCKTVVQINKNQKQPTTSKLQKIPGIELAAFNKPLEYFYVDGVYYSSNTFFKKNKQFDYLLKELNWDNFTLSFEFNTSVNRMQNPIMLSRGGRVFGFLLDVNGGILIRANQNGERYLHTKGVYKLNKWHTIKAVKKGKKTQIFLDEVLIGSYNIGFKDSVYTSDKTITSANYGNGVSFNGGLRNIFFINDGNHESSEILIKKYKSYNKDDNILFKKETPFLPTKETLDIIGFDWDLFNLTFDYQPPKKKGEHKLILGKRWRLIEFITENNNLVLSINNGRTRFKTNYSFKKDKNYSIQLKKVANKLSLIINDEQIFSENISLSNPNLNKENTIFYSNDSNDLKSYYSFKNLIVQKKSKENKYLINSNRIITKTNHIIFDPTEGVICKDLFEQNYYGNGLYSKDSRTSYAKRIPHFNSKSFSVNFDFISESKKPQVVLNVDITVGIINSPKIGLWVDSKNRIVLKIKDKPIKAITTLEDLGNQWNNCFMSYNKEELKVYINKQLVFKTKMIIDYPSKKREYKGFLRSKDKTAKSSFKGELKNIIIYESSVDLF